MARSESRSHPICWLAMFAIGFGIWEAILGRFGSRLDAPPISAKLEVLAHRSGEIDTLFLGSSRVYHGFSPESFDGRMGELGAKSRSFNLAADGMNFPESGYVLEQALAVGLPRLRRVFLELSALQTILAEGQWGTRRFEAWHDWVRTQAVCSWLLAHGDRATAMEHLNVMLRHYNTAGRGVDTITRIFQEGFAPVPSQTSGDGYLPIRQVMTAPELERFRQQVAAMNGAAREQKNDPQIQATIARAIRRVQATGAEVILVSMPAAKRAPHVFDNSGAILMLEFDDPGTFPELYAPADRYDPAHLNAVGAEKFSRKLADMLMARPGS